MQTPLEHFLDQNTLFEYEAVIHLVSNLQPARLAGGLLLRATSTGMSVCIYIHSAFIDHLLDMLPVHARSYPSLAWAVYRSRTHTL